MAINGVMMQYFESTLDFEDHLYMKIVQEARKLHKHHITALWMPPAFKGCMGRNDVGYGVYDLYDLGEFDQKWTIPTKYGTKDEYLYAIYTLHRNSIQVYPDIVFNHKMGADGFNIVEGVPVSDTNRNHPIGKKRPLKVATHFYFKNRPCYSPFIWTSDHFNGIDYDLYSRERHIYLLGNKQWSEHVSRENGNYEYLMGANIDVNQKDVRKELNDFGKWYLEMTDLDGYRLDAIKHIDYVFYEEWLTNMRKIKPDLFAVGEFFDGRVEVLEEYLSNVHYCMSLFDVPLHYRFYDCSKDKEHYDLRKLFYDTLVSRDPMHAVTFVDNHDTAPNQGLNSFVEKWFKPMAYACILLRQSGYPCIFYGDYYGLKKNRYTGIQKELNILLEIRYDYLTDYQHDFFDDPSCIGWSNEGGFAVIFALREDHTKWMYVGKQYASLTFKDVFHKQSVVINEDGWGEFKTKKNTLSVYILK